MCVYMFDRFNPSNSCAILFLLSAVLQSVTYLCRCLLSLLLLSTLVLRFKETLILSFVGHAFESDFYVPVLEFFAIALFFLC